MSKRFKDLKEGDHIFIIENAKLNCPKMTEVIVYNDPLLHSNDRVSFSAEYKKGHYIMDFPSMPAEHSYYKNDQMIVSTNRERAVSYHKKVLRELLDTSTRTITHEMMVSREILDEMRRAEKIRYENT
jgi:hypothetical protein